MEIALKTALGRLVTVAERIELTRSRPYRKNDQAWIEQKNGAVVRKLLGYRRFEGLAAARAITRLYGASRLFVNFFQPSFKLAAKSRDGAKVTKRYHPRLTPCDDVSAMVIVDQGRSATYCASATNSVPQEITTSLAHQADVVATG